MKKKIITLNKIAIEPKISKNREYLHFGDIFRGEHIVPVNTIRLATQFISEAKNADEEPEILYSVITEGRSITVTGCLWFEIQDFLLAK